MLPSTVPLRKRRGTPGFAARNGRLRFVAHAAMTKSMRRKRNETANGKGGVAESEQRQFVTALARGLSVLAAFEPEDHTLGNQEIAERTALPKPTVSRLTFTLRALGYLTYHPRIGRYGLSPAVLELGHAALSSTGIASIARPVMRELSEMDDVAIALGIRSRDSIRYIELVRRPEAVVLSLDVGSRLPLLESAMGRAYLAHLPDDERDALVRELTEPGPATRKRANEAIAQTVKHYRETGYVRSLGEWRPEIHAIATVIEPATGGEPLIMNMGGLASILTPDRIAKEFGPALVGAARRIQVQMRSQLAT